MKFMNNSIMPMYKRPISSPSTHHPRSNKINGSHWVPLIRQCGSSADFGCERFQTFPHASLSSVSPANLGYQKLGLSTFRTSQLFCILMLLRTKSIGVCAPNMFENTRLQRSTITRVVILNRQCSRRHTLYSSFIIR